MKKSEIEKLSLEDLQDKLTGFQKQLFDLKMNHAVSPLENPLQIKTVRKTVARLFTAITAKKIKLSPEDMENRNLRKERIGIVTSNKMQKSIVVSEVKRVKHPCMENSF